MDIWIISDDSVLASLLRRSLQRQAVECAENHVVGTGSLDLTLAQLADCAGIVFTCVDRLTPAEVAKLRQIRGALGTDTKLVVVSPVTNHSVVVSAVRAGANDFLVADGSLDQEVAAFLSRVQLEQKQKEEVGTVISVVPSHSLADVNLLAVNLSAAIATSTGSCGLLDFLTCGGDLALLLKVSPRHSITDLLNQRDTIDEDMLRQAVTAHDSGIQLLSGPASFVDAESSELQACPTLTALAQRCWPAVVLATESARYAEKIGALSVSDLVIVTIRLDVASLYRAQKEIDFLVQHGVPRERIRVVATGAGIAGELPVAAVKKILKIADIWVVPDDATATLMSINVGNPLVLEAPKAKPAVAVRRIAESILGVADSETESNGIRSATVAKAAAVLALNTLSFCR